MNTNINSEIESILITLKGSQWAKEQTVNTVIQEYERLVDASKNIHHKEQKPALQILFSSRAIDTLLEFVVNRDRATRKLQPIKRLTIGQAINNISSLIDQFTIHDLKVHVKDKRNTYLHQAGIFPTNNEMEQFLHATARGISELINKIP
jgi:hypothetical protein